MDKVHLSRDGEEGSCVLFPTWIVALLRSGGKVIFDCTRRGWLTGWLTHTLWTGVVFAIGVMTEARVLEGMFAFRGVDIRLRRAIEADSLSFDDFGVGRWLGKHTV